MRLLERPKTIKDTARYIKLACDRYWMEEISYEQIRDYIFTLNETSGIYSDNDINVTIGLIIGKRRKDFILGILRENER